MQLPLAEVETDAGGYDEESHEVGGIGAAAGKVQASGVCSCILAEHVDVYRQRKPRRLQLHACTLVVGTVSIRRALFWDAAAVTPGAVQLG